MAGELYHHRFNPWRVKDNTRVVAAESAWRKIRNLNNDADHFARKRCSVTYSHHPHDWCDGNPHGEAWQRPRIMVDVDVFEDWQGPMSTYYGRQLFIDERGRWFGRPVDKPDGWIPGPNSSIRTLTMQDVRSRLFDLIDQTPNLDWILLTKRPENVLKMLPPLRISKVLGAYTSMDVMTRQNLWLGVSVENQQAADERIPHLLKVPAAVRFLSCEPLLGPVDLRPKAPDTYSILGKFYHSGTFDPTGSGPAVDRVLNCFPKIHWVIVGGESGHGARPCRVEWIRDIVRQCKAAGVPVFVKQLGSNPVGDERQPEQRDPVNGMRMLEVMQVLTIRDRKGGDIAEFPADLQIREFPEVRE